MQFLKSDSSFSRQDREEKEGRYISGNNLLWVAVIAVLIGLNLAAWSYCMWVFGQPEQPINYKMLTYLEKLEPIQGFVATTAPRGKFHSSKDLYAKVYPFSQSELKEYSGILKRNYLKNYKERDDVVYLSGDFLIEAVRVLTEEDIFTTLTEEDGFTSGLVVRAKAEKFPDAYIELLIPSKEVPKGTYKVGEELKVEESLTCAAVLNIDRREDDVMIFTAIPLVKRSFEMSDGSVITVAPPERLNLTRNIWPIMGDAEELDETDAKSSDDEDPKDEGDGTQAKPKSA